MGVSPIHEYPAIVGYESYNHDTYKRVGARWKVVSEYVGKDDWEIRQYLQIKVNTGTVSQIALHQETSGVYTSHVMTNVGERGAAGFSGNTWQTAYIDGATNGYISSKYSGSGIKNDTRETGVWHITLIITSASPSVAYGTIRTTVPSAKYGGNSLEYPLPQFETNVSQTEITLEGSIRAPYDGTYEFKLRRNGSEIDSVSGTYEIDATDGYSDEISCSFTNLSVYADYYLDIKMVCENGQVYGYAKHITTLPVYVESINVSRNGSELNDIYINEGDSEDILYDEIAVLPNNATNKTLLYDTNSKKYYVSAINNGIRLTAYQNTASNFVDIFVLNGQDGFVDFGALKLINVHFRRPATDIYSGVSTQDGTVRLTVGQTYTINYRISPDGSTDKTVTITSSDTNVATVNNNIVTAVDGGTATITLTLERLGTSSTSPDTISTSFQVSVIDSEEFIYPSLESYLTAEYIEITYSNLTFLRNALDGYVYDPNESAISIDTFPIVETEGRNTKVCDVGIILNQIESCIDKMYAGTKDIAYSGSGWIDAANLFYEKYYDGQPTGAPLTWSGQVTNAFDRIFRWYNYLDSIYQFALEIGAVEPI